MGVVHPLLIHFPISLLLLAFFLEIYSLNKQGKKYKASIPLITLLGGIGAVLSAGSGYVLMDTGDYESTAVLPHRNWGIALALGSVVLTLLYRYPPKIPYVHLAGQGLLSIIVVITGHLGGNLTHGEDFLQLNQPEKEKAAPVFKKESLVYQDIVVPILEQKCVSCHGPSKQKGKLRLDQLASLLRGGKNGFYHGEEAKRIPLMSHRMNLPSTDKQHMPPKGKAQLTDQEKKIMLAWLNEGASSQLLLKDLKVNEESASITEWQEKVPDWPSVPDLEIIPDATLNPLREKGIVILPLANNHPLLQINCQSVPDLNDDDWEPFNAFKQHIASLRLSGTQISDKSLKWISLLPNLTKLYLDNTKVSDAGLMLLSHSKELRYLNLVGTKVTEKGLLSLHRLPHLRSVYLYQSEVKPESLIKIQDRMSSVYFDLGGYKIDTLAQKAETEEK